MSEDTKLNRETSPGAIPDGTYRSVGGALKLCCKSCSCRKTLRYLVFRPPLPGYTLDNTANVLEQTTDDSQPLPGSPVIGESKVDDSSAFPIKFVPKTHYALPHDVEMSAELLPLQCQNEGKLEFLTVWYRHVNPRKTLLFSHGNASDCGRMHPLMAYLAHHLEVNIVAYEFPGYGNTRGVVEPIPRNVALAARNTYDRILSKGWAGRESDIIVMGESLGSGPTCFLGYARKPGGVILISGILSTTRVMTNRCFPSCSGCCCCLDMFDNYQAITRIRCPVLLIHGKQDTLVKPYHSRLLNDRVSPGVHHTFTLIDEAGHNDIWKRESVVKVVQAIRSFLMETFAGVLTRSKTADRRQSIDMLKAAMGARFKDVADDVEGSGESLEDASEEHEQVSNPLEQEPDTGAPKGEEKDTSADSSEKRGAEQVESNDLKEKK